MTMLSPLGRVPRRRPPVRRRTRRPVPALILLLILFVLASVVWWRVLHRASATASAAACPPSTIANALSLDPHKVDVRVYNATNRHGLATQVATLLHGRGFHVLVTDNDPLAASHQVSGVGELRYGPTGAAHAVLLSLEIPGIKLTESPRTDAVVDVALGPGYVTLASATQYAQARQQLAARASNSPTATC